MRKSLALGHLELAREERDHRREARRRALVELRVVVAPRLAQQGAVLARVSQELLGVDVEDEGRADDVRGHGVRLAEARAIGRDRGDAWAAKERFNVAPT